MLQSVMQTALSTNSTIGDSTLVTSIGGPNSPTPSIDSDSLSGGMAAVASGSTVSRSSILVGSGIGGNNSSCDANSDNISNGSRSESSGLGSITTSTIIGSGRPLCDGGNGELGRPNVGRSASSSSTASSSSSGLGSSPLGGRASSASSLFTSTSVAGTNGVSGCLVQHSGSTGGSPAIAVKCWHCCNNFDRPKVLHGCFHTFCEPCLEKIQDHPEKITCPQCSTDSILGNAGISGLLSDFGIFGMMESSTVNGEHHIQSNICTSCKNRDSTAVARCLTCSNFLCPNCVTAHQFMRCFDGHHVTTLGELTNKDGCPQEIQQLNSISHIMQEGRSKASDLKSNLKNLEAASINLSQHFSKSRSDVNEAFQYYVSLLEERKHDVLRELEGQYSRKQVALSLYSQKAHETIDRIYQVTSFMDRQMRHSSNSEVLMFKHPLEQQFSTLSNNMNAIENIGSLSSEDVCDFEFISNYQAIQMGVRSTFGYLSSRNSTNASNTTENVTQSTLQQNSNQNVSGPLSISMGGCNAVGGPTSKQPPISRPNSMSATSALNGLNENSQGSSESGLILSSLIGNVSSNSGNSSSDNSNVLNNGWAQGLANLTTLSSNNPSNVSSMLNGGHQNHSQQNHMHSNNGSANRMNSNLTVNGAGNQQHGNSANILANGINGIHLNSVNNDGLSHQVALKNGIQLEHQRHTNHFGSPSSPLPSSLSQSISHHQQHNSSFNTNNSVTSLCQNSQQLSTNGNLFENGLLSKRNNAGPSLGSLLNGVSEYEKWSNGSNSVDHSSVGSAAKMHLFGNGDNLAAAVAAYGAGLNSGSNSGASNSIHTNAVNNDVGRGLTGNVNGTGQNQLNNSSTTSNNATAESIMELSTKMLQVQQHQYNSSQNSQASLSNTGSSTSSMFPPKSQIKRQKMIYHCKFGEFGVLEGQFTEPSGVAVNAQNDIIVADTNNHRIQIFDKEGRFKFQFGECGKRDGQLLYPNRVAAVRASGDIIVTERSPTHQVQIYNQYGQFVRKFGANILQHPRGVCVDNKGRIIVVECKVMRVIIFDQMGNVLNKFGCSKHLEFPNGVVVNDRQEIFISDNRAHCVKVFNYEGTYLRQIGGEGLTNYPIGVGINGAGEVTIADNHNNFNLSVFSQEGQLLSALESKVKHAQCFDVALMDDGSVVLASKDYRLYIYRYVQLPPMGMLN